MNNQEEFNKPLLESDASFIQFQGSQLKEKENMNTSYKEEDKEESKERFSLESYKSDKPYLSYSQEFYFSYTQNRFESVHVELQNKALYINLTSQKKKQWYIDPNDLMGAKFDNKSSTIIITENKVEVYEIQIYYYQKNIQKKCSKKCLRNLNYKSFYHTNQNIIKNWANLINLFSKQKDFFEKNINISIENLQHYDKKKLLVYVNPRGGSGKALSLWETTTDLLEKCGYETDLRITQHAKYAYNEIYGMPKEILKKYYGILSVSGDGLAHEIINALMRRNDHEDLKEIAIGFLPGGSGNGMAKNICHLSGEQNNLQNLIYIIGKGNKRDIDLMYFEKEGEEPTYGILSMEWAFMADIDIESECLRCFGGSRFTIWAIGRLLFLRKYRAKLFYTTKDINIKNIKLSEDLPEEDWNKMDDIFTHFFVSNVPFISSSNNISPLSNPEDGLLELQMIHGINNIGRWKLLKFLLNMDDKGNIIDCSQKKPWDNSGLQYVQAKAFRLEPNDHRGYMTIDGEEYRPGKIQGGIIPKALKIFVL